MSNQENQPLYKTPEYKAYAFISDDLEPLIMEQPHSVRSILLKDRVINKEGVKNRLHKLEIKREDI